MKRNRLISLCLMLAMLFGVFTFTPGLESRAYAASDAVEDARESVVRVLNNYSVGTGFTIGRKGSNVKYVLTNYHVVKEDLSSVHITTTDLDGRVKAEVIFYDEVNDFAILELDEELNDRKPIALLSPKELHVSQEIYCIGFPGVSDKSSSNVNYNSRVGDMTTTKGIVSNAQYEYMHVEEYGVSYITICVMSDAIVNWGNSGGPMIDEHGQVVGINTWGIAPDLHDNYSESDRFKEVALADSMSLAVSIDYVTKKLDDLDIDYIKGDPDGSPQAKFKNFVEDNLLFILIGGGAVIVLVLVLVLTLSRKKPATMPTKPTEPPTDRPVNNPNYQNQNYQPNYPPPPPPQRMLVVRCERGPLQGKSARGMSVRVGRTPNCQLIFPSGTPCVSREHCEIRLNGQSITVTDLGSSYGTILSSGERLSAGQSRAVREGDIILLGSKEVVVSVSLG